MKQNHLGRIVHLYTRVFLHFQSTKKSRFGAAIIADGLLSKVGINTELNETAIIVLNINDILMKGKSAMPWTYSSFDFYIAVEYRFSCKSDEDMYNTNAYSFP